MQYMVNPNSYLNKITLKELDLYFEWIKNKRIERDFLLNLKVIKKPDFLRRKLQVNKK